MKKLLILVVLSMVLLTACAPAQTDSTQSGVNACFKPENLFVVCTVDGYYEFIANQKLPADFIHFDSLPSFGTFCNFITFTDQFPDYYEYTFYDVNGKNVKLTVTHNVGNNRESTEKYPRISVTSDMTSLAKAPCKQYSVIEHNGVIYLYASSGYLTNIIWYENGTEFKLSAHWSSKDEAFILRLMSLSETESKAAIDEIKAALTK